eukprot:Selendium_serpulae@DN6003_c0_g1_i4.p1
MFADIRQDSSAVSDKSDATVWAYEAEVCASTGHPLSPNGTHNASQVRSFRISSSDSQPISSKLLQSRAAAVAAAAHQAICENEALAYKPEFSVSCGSMGTFRVAFTMQNNVVGDASNCSAGILRASQNGSRLPSELATVKSRELDISVSLSPDQRSDKTPKETTGSTHMMQGARSDENVRTVIHSITPDKTGRVASVASRDVIEVSRPKPGRTQAATGSENVSHVASSKERHHDRSPSDNHKKSNAKGRTSQKGAEAYCQSQRHNFRSRRP